MKAWDLYEAEMSYARTCNALHHVKRIKDDITDQVVQVSFLMGQTGGCCFVLEGATQEALTLIIKTLEMTALNQRALLRKHGLDTDEPPQVEPEPELKDYSYNTSANGAFD